MSNEIIDIPVDDQTNIDAMADTETDDGVYVHVFKKPFEYQGKTYQELHFDFGSLTGRDHLAIENEMAALGLMFVDDRFSGEFLRRAAARACKEHLGSDAFEQMPIKEYRTIRNKTRSFI